MAERAGRNEGGGRPDYHFGLEGLDRVLAELRRIVEHAANIERGADEPAVLIPYVIARLVCVMTTQC